MTILLVHGLWGTLTEIEPLRHALATAGLSPVHGMVLTPNTGHASIPELAHQIAERVNQIRASEQRVDLVGFSMGALACRSYIQRGDGKQTVRRFVSISGPHQGTLTAFASGHAGVRQMRPRSDFLSDLASDVDPWGPVEVHVIYTPFDLMIVPPRSAELPGAKTVHRVPVPVHRFMITDARVQQLVATLLREPNVP